MKNKNTFSFILATFIISLSTFHSFSQEDTTSVKNLMKEGILRMEAGKFKEAIEVFDKGRDYLHKIAVKQDEKNINTIRSLELTRQAEREIRQNNFEGALTLLNEAIEYNDRNIEAYKYRGSVRLILEEQIDRKKSRNYQGLLNDYTNAINIAIRAVDATPRNSQERKEVEKEIAKILINRAYVKMQSGRRAGFHSAIDDYTLAIRYDDQNWDGFLGRAVAFNSVKDYRREVQDYLKAIELIQKFDFRMTDKEWAKLYLNVALAYVNIRQPNFAFEYSTKSYNLGNAEAEKIMERSRPK